MKSIIIKAVSSLHREQNGGFILARLLDLLFTPLSQMCHARGGTWLKWLLDSPEPPRRRLWVKWPESYFERRAAWQPAAASTTTAEQQWSEELLLLLVEEEEVRGEKHILCDFHIMRKSQQLYSEKLRGFICVQSVILNKPVTIFLKYLIFSALAVFYYY